MRRLSASTLRRRFNRNPIKLPSAKVVADKRQKVDVNLAKKAMRDELTRNR